MAEVRYYLNPRGRSPFETWFLKLGKAAAAKITVSLARLEQDNTSNVKSVGAGVQELRVNWGPGYRVYFGFDGETIVVLLNGGEKKRQQLDIEEAKVLWLDYKQRKLEN